MSNFRLTHPPRYECRTADSDFHPTPPWVTKLLLLHCPPPPGVIVEPSAGRGDIARPLISAGYTDIVAVEIRPECYDDLAALGVSVQIGDWLRAAKPPELSERWLHASIVGNPPFSLDLEFAESCIATEAPYVALLFRLNFLASAKRAHFNNAHPVKRLLVLGNRPSFSGDGKTDASDYAWFIWGSAVQAAPPRVVLRSEVE